MRIGILGAGNVGGSLARVWTSKGHQVMLGVPDAQSESTQKAIAMLGGTGRAGTNADAAAFGEILVLAVPWSATQAAIESCGDLRGKVLAWISTENLSPKNLAAQQRGDRQFLK